MKGLGLLFVLLGVSTPVWAGEDWAYELSPDARSIYEKKQTQVPCENIPNLLKTRSEGDLFIAIRDAALFDNKACGEVIRKNRRALERVPGLKDAIAFYYLLQGQKQQLQRLAAVFDREARDIGDHPMVELFGFLSDWEVSGIRLVRHAGYADASGAESLCSALMWRRYLYGEQTFKQHWYELGAKEKIPVKRLDDFYAKCQSAP
jgi:hypothetical protein